MDTPSKLPVPSNTPLQYLLESIQNELIEIQAEKRILNDRIAKLERDFAVRTAQMQTAIAMVGGALGIFELISWIVGR